MCGAIARGKVQVNAINWFHKESPILVIDSAYGAGKSLCTAVMAEGAVEKGKIVLIAAVQNSALDVICAKLAELKSDHMRPVRYLNETLARDAVRHGPFDMGTLMEQFHETHADHLSKKDFEQFQRFAQHRQMLREFVFHGEERNMVTSDHKKLLLLERQASKAVKVLTKTFLRAYQPNVFICTIASALNLTTKGGLWRKPSRTWTTVLLDEASMIPAATLITLFSRFQTARYTLVGDSNQLPPYVGVYNVPLAIELSSQSILDVAQRMGNPPVCKIRTVYRPHPALMELNSHFFYNNELVCGTSSESRQNLLQHVKMPNPNIPLAFVNVMGHSVKSITGSHSNETEANAAHVLVRFLLLHGIRAEDITLICLYRDQKYLCDNVLRATGVTVGTVDSAQGSERSVVIVCTTRTHMDPDSNHTFFADRKRLNVALSRARDGMFILGCVPHLIDVPVWRNIINWCQSRSLVTPLEFFDATFCPNLDF
ncbi:hypothetical protein Q1695_003823 [Nippostrongylus brasiliensis]|nr:hypothetical protein Q1695_003823 [Nippostrongylus brasiliensis]